MYFSMQYIEDEISKLKRKKEELWKELSHYDKQLSDAYHKLEIENFDKEASFRFTKQLQIITRTRRKAKFEIMQIESIIHNLYNIKQKLDSNEKKYFSNQDTYKEYIYN